MSGNAQDCAVDATTFRIGFDLSRDLLIDPHFSSVIPAKAGIHGSDGSLLAQWTLAFAGVTYACDGAGTASRPINQPVPKSGSTSDYQRRPAMI
jgi:hypothetical protein